MLTESESNTPGETNRILDIAANALNKNPQERQPVNLTWNIGLLFAYLNVAARSNRFARGTTRAALALNSTRALLRQFADRSDYKMHRICGGDVMRRYFTLSSVCVLGTMLVGFSAHATEKGHGKTQPSDIVFNMVADLHHEFGPLVDALGTAGFPITIESMHPGLPGMQIDVSTGKVRRVTHRHAYPLHATAVPESSLRNMLNYSYQGNNGAHTLRAQTELARKMAVLAIRRSAGSVLRHFRGNLGTKGQFSFVPAARKGVHELANAIQHNHTRRLNRDAHRAAQEAAQEH